MTVIESVHIHDVELLFTFEEATTLYYFFGGSYQNI